MIPLLYNEINKCKKNKINHECISELKCGQMYKITLNCGKTRFCRFNDRIGNTLYFVKFFTVNGKLKGFSVSIHSINTIFEIDYKFDYMFQCKRIIKDYNKILISSFEIEYI